MDFIYLAGGFVLLLLAGDLLVRGSVSLAEKLGVPSLVIGLTIVAFGTSAPELAISLDAALSGFGGISIGNVVGSNIANILLVLGVPAIIRTIPCGGMDAMRGAMFMIFATIVFIILAFMQPFVWWHGVILLAVLAWFLLDSFHQARKAKAQGKEVEDPLEELEDRPDNLLLAAVFLLLGLIGLPLGGHLTIEGATGIAKAFGVSDATIGLTVIALGTSLPELSTSVTAALRGHVALAVGNVIGSNIFNILAILGITATVTPLSAPEQLVHFDMWVMALTSLMLLPLIHYSLKIGRLAGILMTLGYCLYIFTVFQFDAV